LERGCGAGADIVARDDRTVTEQLDSSSCSVFRQLFEVHAREEQTWFRRDDDHAIVICAATSRETNESKRGRTPASMRFTDSNSIGGHKEGFRNNEIETPPRNVPKPRSRAERVEVSPLTHQRP
jgi:hypothetical protein